MSLIVALDFPTEKEIISFAKKIVGKVDIVKVGLEAYIGCGPRIVEEIHGLGFKTFLDLKFYDIPRTVGATVKQVSNLGCEMLTVHGSSGEDAVKAALDNCGNTKVIAITQLTSKNSNWQDINELGEKIINCGAHGIVCPWKHLNLFKTHKCLKITPGIRLTEESDDHFYACTPEVAMSEGASHIVVGRPIYQSKDPLKTIEIIKERC